MTATRAKRIRIRFPLGLKMVGALVFLLLCSGASLVWFSTQLFVRDTTATIQQVNSDLATGVAARLGDFCESLAERLKLGAAVILRADERNKPELLFADDKELLGFLVIDTRAAEPKLIGQYHAGDFEADWSTPQAALAFLKSNAELAPMELARGEVQVGLSRLADGTGALAIGVPVVRDDINKDRFCYVVAAWLKPDVLSRVVGTATVARAFAVDKRGRLLAAEDPSLGAPGDSLEDLPVVRDFLHSANSNAQLSYRNPQSGIDWLSTFHSVGFGGLGVVAEVPMKKALEAAERAQYRALLIAAMVICIFVFVGFLFSTSITRRVRPMVEATQSIASGEFSSRVQPRGHDELAWLARAFNDMAHGLQERERMKDVFRKFHSRQIAEKLLSGEVKLGGERREAIILFSDIRGFTTISEATDPSHVVEMLNEYLTAMVAVIRRHGGVVDKYIGDAIMALWGVPEAGPQDAERAVRAALEMRQELAQLNQLRQLRGQASLKIGIGIHCGEVVAGNIGSEEKMEYTVVGDAVNLASRVESLTKEFKTDLLITENLRLKIGERFELESAGEVVARGKSTATVVHLVRRERPVTEAAPEVTSERQAA